MLRGRYGAENVPGSALMFRQIGPNGLGHLGIVRIKAGQHGGEMCIRDRFSSCATVKK